MNHHDHDQDDPVILTDADKAELQQQIEYIDTQLADCGDSFLYRELQRERAHAIDELSAGRRLLMTENEED